MYSSSHLVEESYESIHFLIRPGFVKQRFEVFLFISFVLSHILPTLGVNFLEGNPETLALVEVACQSCLSHLLGGFAFSLVIGLRSVFRFNFLEVTVDFILSEEVTCSKFLDELVDVNLVVLLAAS